MFFQCIEALIPLAAVLLDPGKYFIERLGAYRQGPPLGVRCAFDQPSSLQHFEVLGDCGCTYLEEISDLPDCRGPL